MMIMLLHVENLTFVHKWKTSCLWVVILEKKHELHVNISPGFDYQIFQPGNQIPMKPATRVLWRICSMIKMYGNCC